MSPTRTDLTSATRAWLTLTIIGLLDPASSEAFTIHAVEIDEQVTRFALEVQPAELGRVIGKQGRTARCIRTLLSARSMRDGYRYQLDIQRPPAAPADDVQ